jgi:hypothetical protein
MKVQLVPQYNLHHPFRRRAFPNSTLILVGMPRIWTADRIESWVAVSVLGIDSPLIYFGFMNTLGKSVTPEEIRVRASPDDHHTLPAFGASLYGRIFRIA